MPITLLWKLVPAAIALLFIGGAFVAGYRYNEAQHVKEKADLVLQAQKDLQDEIDRKHKLALEYEKKLQDMALRVRTVVKTVEVEIEKPVYKDCVLPPTGVSTINNAAKTYNEARGTPEAVKKTDGSKAINRSASRLNSDRNTK